MDQPLSPTAHAALDDGLGATLAPENTRARRLRRSRCVRSARRLATTAQLTCAVSSPNWDAPTGS